MGKGRHFGDKRGCGMDGLSRLSGANERRSQKREKSRQMNAIHKTRLKLRGELEAPPALRQFGSGWISGVLGFVLGSGGLLMVLAMRAPNVLSMPETRA